MFWNPLHPTAKRHVWSRNHRVSVRRLIVEQMEDRRLLSAALPFGNCQSASGAQPMPAPGRTRGRSTGP